MSKYSINTQDGISFAFYATDSWGASYYAGAVSLDSGCIVLNTVIGLSNDAALGLIGRLSQ
jgi:hypothetical protein